MHRRSLFSALFAMGLLVASLAGCGKKPDGTPYGVDPARLPEGRRKARSATASCKKARPNRAEPNAVTNGAKAG